MKSLKSVLAGLGLGAFLVIVIAAASGQVYFGTFRGPVLAQNVTLTNWLRRATNPVVANVLDSDKGYQLTNCSANPTFSGIGGTAVQGQGFEGLVVILANGADRTVTTPANVHVYPSGTLVVTNGSLGIFSYGGSFGTYTAGVFLAFP